MVKNLVTVFLRVVGIMTPKEINKIHLMFLSENLTQTTQRSGKAERWKFLGFSRLVMSDGHIGNSNESTRILNVRSLEKKKHLNSSNECGFPHHSGP